MKRDSVVFGLAGTFFGLMVGWILGTQQAGPVVPGPAATPPAAAAAAPQTPPPPPPLDTQRVSDLERRATAAPKDAAVREELGNLYFDSQRFDLAITWYEAAVALDPRNVNVSTDLAICYYYTNQTDKSLAQLARSLAVDPVHLKTLLNLGIVRAFGKLDYTGATTAWEQVITLAPNSQEAGVARQGLDGIKSKHGGAVPPAGRGGAPPPNQAPDARESA